MKDVRHHLGRIQRDVIRSARREAAEAAEREQRNSINGHESKTPEITTAPQLPLKAAA